MIISGERRVSYEALLPRIAKAAGVPVVPAYFHYGRKVIGIGAPFELTDDYEADVARIRGWYRSVSNGKNHDA